MGGAPMVMVMKKVDFFRFFITLRGRGLDVSGVAEPSLRVIWCGNMVDGLPRPASFVSKNGHSSRSYGSISLSTSKTPTTFYGESACNDEESRKSCFRQNNRTSRSGMEVEFL